MKRLKFLVLAASMLASPALLAHTDEVLDTQKSPNGGQLRVAGKYHFELIVAKDSPDAKDSPIIVYVTDHDGVKIPVAGGVGTATILSGKIKTTANLVPDGDNRLKGVAKYASSPGMKVVISLTLPGKSPGSARFTPHANTMAEGMEMMK